MKRLLSTTQPLANRRRATVHARRRGTMAPAAIVVLVVVISGVALVLDKLWLDAANIELQTAAESAALASGGELATDDLLKPDFDQTALLERARHKGKAIARANKLAGNPVNLDDSEEGDIRFGKIVVQGDSGREVFVETQRRPTSVVVRAEHSRSRNNPVALFFQGLTGQDGGDVTALAEASIDNRIVGLQPLDSVPVPALPLAILKSCEDDSRLDTWDTAITSRRGADRFCFHEDTGEIASGPDGIPEITLKTAGRDEDVNESNMFLFAAKHTATHEDIIRQLRFGWTEDDLPAGADGLRLDRSHHEFLTLNGAGGSLPNELADLVGQCRIVFLFDEFQQDQYSREGRIRCVRAVAGRILDVRLHSNEACEIVFQPGVLTTRTALLAAETLVQGSWDRLANPYIYKLRLTH